MANRGNGGRPGPGVDLQGREVVDPSVNVKALNEAGLARQDDLREREARWMLRMGSVVVAGSVGFIVTLAGHQKELGSAESARIDAIRSVDVGTAARAADVLATAQQALATQATVAADTLRGLVAPTASTLQQTLATQLQPITTAIEALRAAQFTQQGQAAQRTEGRGDSQWLLTSAIALGAVVLTYVLFNRQGEQVEKTSNVQGGRWMITSLIAIGAVVVTYVLSHPIVQSAIVGK